MSHSLCTLRYNSMQLQPQQKWPNHHGYCARRRRQNIIISVCVCFFSAAFCAVWPLLTQFYYYMYTTIGLRLSRLMKVTQAHEPHDDDDIIPIRSTGELHRVRFKCILYAIRDVRLLALRSNHTGAKTSCILWLCIHKAPLIPLTSSSQLKWSHSLQLHIHIRRPCVI